MKLTQDQLIALTYILLTKNPHILDTEIDTLAQMNPLGVYDTYDQITNGEFGKVAKALVEEGIITQEFFDRPMK